jgi:hypothetical protein
MKTKNRFLSSLAAMAILAGIALSSAQAATNVWVGDTDNVFTNNLNWTGDALPNFGTDIMRFDGPGTQGNSTITGVNLTMTNTGTGAGTTLAQILFSGSTPAMTLSGGTITLGTAATNIYNNAIVLSSGSTVTQTIGSNIVIDDGKAYTASFVNASNSGTGAVLAFTGNITGGTGGTAGLISLGFGNTSTHNGDYSVSGNITKGATATGINITKRGTGVLTLSGTNVLGANTAGGLAQNEAGTIRINGGTTTVNNIIDTTNAIGGNSGVASTLQISAGALTLNGGRGIRANVLVDGGTFNIGTVGSGGRFSLDTGRSFNMTSGAVNVNGTTGGFGVRFGGDSGSGAAGAAFTGTQSGGTFSVNGAGGQDTTFSLGSTTASIVNSYALSGGVLDIKGTGTNAFATLGADAAGTSNTTLSLSGTGKLVVRSATTAGSPGSAGVSGIQGRTGSAVQVLSLQGGTLVAGRVDATNLRGSIGGTNGTIVNNGSAIAAGDVGEAGRTAIVGNLQIASGTLLIDVGGTTVVSTWQDTAANAGFDNLVVTGNLELGGALSLSLIDTFTPTALDTFTIVTSNGLTGAFSNVAFGNRLNTLGGEGSFLVNQVGNTVQLSSYQAIPEPSTFAMLGIGMAALWALRRRNSRVS